MRYDLLKVSQTRSITPRGDYSTWRQPLEIDGQDFDQE